MRRLHHVACYLKPDEYSQLKEQAAKRRLSLSTYVKGCLLGHHKAQPFKKDPDNGGPSAVSQLSQESERRIAELAGAKAGEVLRRLAVVISMLDQFALTMLVHIPEVAKEQRKSAAASGERRYQNWKRAVDELVRDMGLGEPAELNGANSTDWAGEGEQ
jgi:hypothetical protein